MQVRFVWGMTGALTDPGAGAVIVDAAPCDVVTFEGADDIEQALVARGVTVLRMGVEPTEALSWVTDHLAQGHDVTVVATGDRVLGGLRENDEDMLAAGALLSALRHQGVTLDNAGLGAAMLWELRPR